RERCGKTYSSSKTDSGDGFPPTMRRPHGCGLSRAARSHAATHGAGARGVLAADRSETDGVAEPCALSRGGVRDDAPRPRRSRTAKEDGQARAGLALRSAEDTTKVRAEREGPMTPERWRQVTAIFHAARTREPEARAAVLDKMCAGDSSLRGEVEA